jgi:leader peptidase (prepilin peptidase)/N-methyltransferase
MVEALVIVGLTGLSLGSFIKACTYRIPLGIPTVSRRSFCPACHSQLRWYEIIPLLSFILQRASCRSCSTRISFRYPIVEAIAAATTIGLFIYLGPTVDLFLAASFCLLMLLVAMIDWQHLIIPNGVVFAGLVIGLGLRASFAPLTVVEALAASGGAFVTMNIIRHASTWLFRREAMGFGDVKLGSVIGLFLGFQGFLVTVWIAAIAGLVYIFARRMIGSSGQAGSLGITDTDFRFRGSFANAQGSILESRIPFGSFLAVTSTAVLVFHDAITDLLDLWLLWMQ